MVLCKVVCVFLMEPSVRNAAFRAVKRTQSWRVSVLGTGEFVMSSPIVFGSWLATTLIATVIIFFGLFSCLFQQASSPAV